MHQAGAHICDARFGQHLNGDWRVGVEGKPHLGGRAVEQACGASSAVLSAQRMCRARQGTSSSKAGQNSTQGPHLSIAALSNVLDQSNVGRRHCREGNWWCVWGGWLEVSDVPQAGLPKAQRRAGT